MGIKGLLPLLKSIQRPTELRKYAGQTLGIDAYVWLHRGAIACAVDLAEGKSTRRYVDFAMHRVRMFTHFGVQPYLVFDGDLLPSKAATEASRAKRREDSKELGMQLLKAGKGGQAHLELQKAIDITPEMARRFIDELKKNNIPFVVAPYEADAQLVYLERQGLIQGIVSEDSDLLVFGAKRLLTKLDQQGHCIEINRRDFCACREVSLTGWTDEDFRHMAILSGCDYLANIGKMGLKTAHRMLKKYKTPERLVRMLRFDGKFSISENYLADFRQADYTFLYQRVFCPIKQEIVLLTEPTTPMDVENMPYIGAPVEPTLARAIACGDVNPMTKEPFVVESATAFLPGPIATNAATSDATSATPTTATVAPNPAIGKPIDDYFSSRRIPLGAMAPNCFALDAGELDRLNAQGLLPRVFPLPRPYLPEAYQSQESKPIRASNRRRTEPVQNLLRRFDTEFESYLSPASSTVVDSHSVNKALPLARALPGPPKKKARLCDDAEGFACEAKSKFFLTTKSKAKSRHTGDFPLSTESINEALASLPDFDGFDTKQSASSISVYDDLSVAQASKPSASSGTRSSSPKRRRSEAGSSVVETPVGTSFQQFAYSRPGVEASASTVGTGRTSRSPLDGASLLSRYRASSSNETPSTGLTINTQRTTPLSTLPISDNRRMSGIMSPLQRISSRALSGGRAVSTPLSANRGNNVTSRNQRSGLGVGPNVDPANIALPRVDANEVLALNCGDEENMGPAGATLRAKTAVMGSEDLMFSESDIIDDQNAGLNLMDRFDLSRFMCP